MVKKYIKLFRIKHYLKNVLVFAPLFFSGSMLANHLLITNLLGFIAFSFISSVVYIVNDIKDAPADRNHPTKCFRPIASGAIKISHASVAAIVLLVLSLLCNYAADGNSMSYFMLFAYLILNFGYSCGLKDVPIIDILLLTFGFILRVAYGSVISGVVISNWLYLAVMSISFYLGLGKRRNEYKYQNENTTRKVLAHYNYNFLDKFMHISLSMFIIFYSLWCALSEIAQKSNNAILITIPIVVSIAMKYGLDIEGDYDGDPIEVVFKDKCLIGLVACLGLLFVCILYI